jgi:drug/metabolite transporter (DMT)-like permease
VSTSSGSLPTDRGWAMWTILWVGVLAASISGILIRYADDAPGVAVSLWRCATGSLVLLPFAYRGIRRMRRRDYLLPIFSGACLAVHFASWITSVNMTTIAASVLLVSTTPVFVALAARWLFKERLGTAVWVGIGLAMAGTALVAGLDLGDSSITGNVLALIGGISAAGYALGGRASRQSLGILEYAAVTYGAAAVLLAIGSVLWGVELTGYSTVTWWAIAGSIVGPQLIGHTLINYVLRDIDATRVSVTIMAEPIIAISLAWFLFDEIPKALAYPGGLAILVGIYMVSVPRRQPVIISE